MQESEALPPVVGACRPTLDGPAAAADGDLRFDFVYRDIAFGCHPADDGAMAALVLDGDIGPMPFSAESASARAELQQVLDAGNAHLGEGLGIVDGRIHLTGRLEIAAPAGTIRRIAAIACFLLRWKPYLDTIAVFVAPAAGPGDARLRPGWRAPSRRVRPPL